MIQGFNIESKEYPVFPREWYPLWFRFVFFLYSFFFFFSLSSGMSKILVYLKNQTSFQGYHSPIPKTKPQLLKVNQMLMEGGP